MGIVISSSIQNKITKTENKTYYKTGFFLLDTCEIKDKTSLHEAESVRDCLKILCDNKLFIPSDVIVIQFLLKKTDCLDLYQRCIKYAEAQNALCFYEKQSG